MSTAGSPVSAAVVNATVTTPSEGPVRASLDDLMGHNSSD